MFLGLDYVYPLSIRSRGRVFRTETSSLKIQTNSSDAQRWELSVTVAPTSTQNVALEDHRFSFGTHTSFTTLMPQPLGVPELIQGNLAGISSDGVTAAGQSAVRVQVTGNVVIPQGLYITFGNDPKIYRVTAETSILTTTTNPTIPIFPPLTQPTVDGESIGSTPSIRVYYAEDGNDSITYQNGGVVRTTVNLVEALV